MHLTQASDDLDQRMGMKMPERVQLSREKGWKMPPNTVKVDRSTRWGNPNLASHHGQSGAVRRVEEELRAGILNFSVDDVRRELRGKNLACWCKPGSPCHADILLRVANALVTGALPRHGGLDE